MKNTIIFDKKVDFKEGETLTFMNTNKIRHKIKNYFTDFENNLINYLKTF